MWDPGPTGDDGWDTSTTTATGGNYLHCDDPGESTLEVRVFRRDDVEEACRFRFKPRFVPEVPKKLEPCKLVGLRSTPPYFLNCGRQKVWTGRNFRKAA